ncbi:Crp/Fnr family transcriptional regulator [Gillisia sp. M10.2A]|uniref:Crp/Fnr family transcriptional regulator n=1 Tax=Gillisia lutea TaxID=2909668 RepID=A0ABS9EHM3_9FLAO|nr:Crp/Fnr family transcriptional regulator [Gillisia lutea]MCF4101664.1 Crp/Fnr family transcriptional regulator [Gillisia lutea]
MKGEHLFRSKYKSALTNCALLNNLDEETNNEILSLFHHEKWPKNTCFLNHEKFFFHFYIILSGRVKMYQVEPNSGKELTLFLLTKSDVFDLFCLLDGDKHQVYYECLDNVKVLAAPMTELRSWLNRHPEHYKNLLPYAGKQLRSLENYVSDITFTDISTRLLKLLIRNVNDKSNTLELINDLSNKELAYLIGSTRAVVNRHLQRLKQNGSIKISRKRLQVKNLSLLLHLLENQKLANLKI